MKKALIALGTFLLSSGVALPANALIKVPFDISHTVGGVSQFLPTGQTQTQAVVGCDLDNQSCVGLTLAESSTDSTLQVTQAVIKLAGFICIADETDPCGTPEKPGTGIVLTTREVVVPAVSPTGLTFQGELCLWAGNPRPEPVQCLPVDIDAFGSSTMDLSDAIPPRIMI